MEMVIYYVFMCVEWIYICNGVFTSRQPPRKSKIFFSIYHIINRNRLLSYLTDTPVRALIRSTEQFDHEINVQVAEHSTNTRSPTNYRFNSLLAIEWTGELWHKMPYSRSLNPQRKLKLRASHCYTMSFLS